jgi:hypothetical protein
MGRPWVCPRRSKEFVSNPLPFLPMTHLITHHQTDLTNLRLFLYVILQRTVDADKPSIVYVWVDPRISKERKYAMNAKMRKGKRMDLHLEDSFTHLFGFIWNVSSWFIIQEHNPSNIQQLRLPSVWHADGHCSVKILRKASNVQQQSTGVRHPSFSPIWQQKVLMPAF